MIFYTERFIPAWAAGCARGPLIFIRPKYRDDVGLLAHEQVHVSQWFKTLGLHPLFYRLSKRYRLWSEVQAYREQAKRYPDDRRLMFAVSIAANYKLSVTTEQAYELLKD